MEEGEKYAKEIGAEFGYVSACAGYGIENFFENIIKKLLLKKPKQEKNDNFTIEDDTISEGKQRKFCCF